MKKIIVSTIFFILFSLSALFLQSTVFSAQPVHIDFFYSSTCPHCANAQDFLTDIKNEYPYINLNEYEVSQNSQRLTDFYKMYRVPPESQGLVPVIFMEKDFYVGFNEEVSHNIRESILATGQKQNMGIQNNPPEKGSLTLPLIGRIDPETVALPIIAMLLGAMDGFNVCSLGALLIILALVLALKSRFKTLVFGGTFIVTTAFVYGLLIFFWYQLFTLISPYLRQMELVIGALTLAGGIYFLREFIKFRKQGPTCEMGPAQKLEGGFTRKFKSLLENKAKTITILISIFAFALVITVVEFPCSAAVPLAFAGMLTKAQLPGWLYLIYILLYVLFYMIDELLIFLIAFFTMKLWLASPKFITWITLVESIIMFALGSYYLFGIV